MSSEPGRMPPQSRPTHTIPARDADPTRHLVPPVERTSETDAMKALASARRAGASVWTWPLLRVALRRALEKLDPRRVFHNPVMFVVEIGALLTTVSLLQLLVTGGQDVGFVLQIALWLWFTVVFANFAEAVAEARGKAQADSLRATKKDTAARRLRGNKEETVSSSDLRRGDVVIVRDGETLPADGEVIDGVAYVNEAAITGESAPVLKEPGTDIRSSVTAGTQVVTGWLQIQASADPGQTFLDRMISLVEGAVRQKTPNEIALSILLSGLTIVFLLAVVTLEPLAIYSGGPISVPVLVALLVCLIPTTIGGLLSAIGIAGMDRVTRFNVLATSGRAVEVAGDVDTLLLDKTGTITYGNRLAAEVIATNGASETDALITARVSSLNDTTPEGRSTIALAEHLGAPTALEIPKDAEFVPFKPDLRMSGVRQNGHSWFKGAVDAILARAVAPPTDDFTHHVDRISQAGGTPLALLMDERIVGLVHLKDTVKPGMRERFEQLRRMGIRTIMMTGDNRLTAATIAAEAGVDGYEAEVRPEDKIRIVRQQQAEGHLVAMAGDGTNDAPALAQADVGLAMNSGTAAAKEAANMIDLDSNPTKLIEVVNIGKQLLITRGAITTFSIANDVAKYFAIIPAAFSVTYPELNALDIMQLGTPQSAVLSAVIFNALIIIALVPLAIRGVAYRAAPAAEMLRRNLLIYGLGGLAAPFIGIKLIDIIVRAIGLA